jgi:hypothetical protein
MDALDIERFSITGSRLGRACSRCARGAHTGELETITVLSLGYRSRASRPAHDNVSARRATCARPFPLPADPCIFYRNEGKPPLCERGLSLVSDRAVTTSGGHTSR